MYNQETGHVTRVVVYVGPAVVYLPELWYVMFGSESLHLNYRS